MPSSSTSPTIAVFGATGHQGAATVNALLGLGASVRALVRDPRAAAATALSERGVELRQISTDDAVSMRDGFMGADAAFVMATMTGPDGIDGEIRIGTSATTAVADAGVPFLVYSSVGGAERDTGIPHFDSKRAIERHVENLNLRRCFLRPVFFMDNLASVAGPTREAGEIVVRLPMPADRPLQMISVEDIGAAAAALLHDPAAAPSAVEIGTAELTGNEIAAAFGARFDVPARYEALPLDVLADDPDQHAMFAWFAGPDAYHADFAATRALVPHPTDFQTWLTGVNLDQ